MKLWKYVETHHEDFGVALFIIPTLVVALVVVGAACGVAHLVQ